MNAPTGEATRDYSRANGPDRPDFRGLGGTVLGLLALGGLGAVALVLSDFSTLYSVPGTASVTGHGQHAYALAITGLAALWLALQASRGVRLAMLGLAALGLLALGIAVIGDLHDVHATGVVGPNLVDTQAQPGVGFYEETLGAALLLISGGGLLVYQR